MYHYSLNFIKAVKKRNKVTTNTFLIHALHLLIAVKKSRSLPAHKTLALMSHFCITYMQQPANGF